MARSRWLPLALAVVAVACDQTLPFAPTSSGPHRPFVADVRASDASATITVSGNDESPYQTVFLTDYPDNLIADVTISGAVHFEGDTAYTPDHLPSGDIGPAGLLSGLTCTLRATVTFRVG